MNRFLGSTTSLFKVRVNGTVHRTSVIYLLDSTEHVEYLFQGDVKVLKKNKVEINFSTLFLLLKCQLMMLLGNYLLSPH